jgi:EAL domain-containing protein (putative c-di-GMP-specific phosphodiesterase class I)
MSINVSRRQLASSHLVADIRDAVRLAGVDARNVVIEVTEGALIQDPKQAAAALSELRALGFRIAIDDFGTGYSSLSYLQSFPVDILKIDKCFVDGLESDSARASALMTSIVGLAHALDLRVVAEGIEFDQQRQCLVDLGCDFGQGFLFSRPLSASRASELVRRTQISSSGIQTSRS